MCLICCKEHPKYVAVGRCGHAEVCWLCAVRMRVLLKDMRCPVCKEELEDVTLLLARRRPVHKESASRHQVWPISFDTEDVRAEVESLFDYSCWQHGCRSLGSCFPSLAALEQHLWEQHSRRFCHTCLCGRGVFLHEQLLYCDEDLGRHAREGDASHILGKRAPALPPHTSCDFCKKSYYSKEVLWDHMHRRHHLCGLCERAGRRGEFYRDYGYLSQHYEERHHVCLHEDCRRGPYRLVVFANETDLHLHDVTDHGSGDKKKGSKQKGVRIPFTMGAASYRDEQDRRRAQGPTAGRLGGGLQARDLRPAGGDDLIIRFAWTKGQPLRAPQERGEQALPTFGAGEAEQHSEEESTLYPDRAPRRRAPAVWTAGTSRVDGSSTDARGGARGAGRGDNSSVGGVGEGVPASSSSSGRLRGRDQEQARGAAVPEGRTPGEALKMAAAPGAATLADFVPQPRRRGAAAVEVPREAAPPSPAAEAPGPALLALALKRIEARGIDAAEGQDIAKYREQNRAFRVQLESTCGPVDMAKFKDVSASFRRDLAAARAAPGGDTRATVRGYLGDVAEVFMKIAGGSSRENAADLLCDLVVLLPDQTVRHALHRELGGMVAEAAAGKGRGGGAAAGRRR